MHRRTQPNGPRMQRTHDHPDEGRAIEQSVSCGRCRPRDTTAACCRQGRPNESASASLTAPATAQQLDQLGRLTASVPHAGRACTREPSERRVAGQRGSTLQAAEGLLLRVMRSPVMRSRGLAASRGAHPASGRAPSTQGMRARVRWTAAWQLPSRRASRSHRLTRKQHPWASRASSAARVELRACPQPYQHWIRSPARSR